MSSHQTQKFTELSTWMTQEQVSVRDLAADTGIDKSKIWRLLNGHSPVFDVPLIEAISRRTKRKIGYREFRAYAERLGLVIPEEVE